ncbi:M3 family oligoendopeptidase [Stratiformator vulcanicus]|uniref:Oligoendopeptidase F, plasmid n=1 Tax=Stratiformator vulcanicus TaxID=2527980 RepID=A0A517QXC3_9PLAN|nr:M3 family oligoendopeptidase [Stratiformator vulcanicus]QDT36305.1 Oligoendopeptidase F, plasmid [Stratiformator vulcanicus]
MSAATYPLTWDLDSIFPNPETPAFEGIIDTYEGDLKKLATRSEALSAVEPDAHSTSEWVHFLRDYGGVAERAGDLRSFIGCHAAADAGNATYRKYEAHLASLSPFLEAIATNVELRLKDLDGSELESFLSTDPELRRNAFFLQNSKSVAALRYPREQELLAAELGVDGIHAWGRLYDRISGDLRITVMERGELVEKSVGQVTFDSRERNVRQNNFFAADKAWETVADDCADALNHIAGTRLTRYRRLGLEDHLTAPLLYNRMKRETLDAMWSAVANRKSRIVDYVDRKAKVLGLEKLAWYDQATPFPVVRGSDARLSYDDACAMIFDTFDGFSPDFGEFARMAIRDRWVEAENRGGKRQGGFCTDFPGQKQTRIFMTFTESADSMSTLAHELGHAYHAWVLKDQPVFSQDYPMNLAETASTFAEQVLGQRRLDQAESADDRLVTLDHMLFDAVSYLMNIHSRFIFESAFYQERAQGELTADRLCELMLAAQKEGYQNSLAADGWHERFWAGKLHFYISELPFYNFPYTFGYLLSLGLYAAADEIDDFPSAYREFLIATGCMTAEEAVQSTLGYDLTEPEFWNRSIDVIDKRITEYLSLTELLFGDSNGS